MLKIDETLVKVNFRCRGYNKKILKGESCIIHISVGQDYSEGEKFLATMDLINETFSYCKIIICDTLQKYTLQIENPFLNDGDAYKQSLELGDKWLERNQLAYKYLTIKNDISRWDEWLHHEQYNYYSEKVEQLYVTNELFKKSIHDTVNKFLKRKRLEENKAAFELCVKYVLEECPVLIPLWALTGCSFVVYPRFKTEAMRAMHYYFLEEDSNLLREVALKFNPRVNPKKISFYRDKKMRSYEIEETSDEN